MITVTLTLSNRENNLKCKEEDDISKQQDTAHTPTIATDKIYRETGNNNTQQKSTVSLSLSNRKKSFKYKVEDDISKQQMKSAMMAHQKHKQQLRKQSQVLARSKLVTNRERIQAAMQNLGQPVVPSPPAAAAAAIQKSMSRSSIESD